MVVTATVITAAGCSDLLVEEPDLLSGADLIFLPQQSTAPPPNGNSFWVRNSASTTRSIRHPDNFDTLFADLSFPPNSIVSVAGASVGANDSARVTVSVSPGRYGLAATPENLVFSASSRPTIRFSASFYGDFSVATSSGRYVDADDYLASLDVWREASPGQWARLPSTVSRLTTSVSASLPGPGNYALAAPR
ncbi:MAG: hypothetical protein ACE5FJ_00770 [Gemmatimonadales bacterium]